MIVSSSYCARICLYGVAEGLVSDMVAIAVKSFETFQDDQNVFAGFT